MQNTPVFRANQIDGDLACVLLIDVQEKLLPLVRFGDRIAPAARKLIEGVQPFSLPVVATEQYAQGLGRTVAPLLNVLSTANAHIIEKDTFSAWAESDVREVMISLDRPQVIIAGIEAHVCVQQTALDLISRDYDVFVCADAVGSRGRLDWECAIQRLRREGASVTTVESVLFELCHRSGTDAFKRMLEVIKAYPPPAE